MAPLSEESKSVLSAILLADSFEKVCTKAVSVRFSACADCTHRLSVCTCISAASTAWFSLPVYMQSFAPVTLEKPKMLLPLVNVPMMDYTLEWLAASEVEEVSLSIAWLLSASYWMQTCLNCIKQQACGWMRLN